MSEWRHSRCRSCSGLIVWARDIDERWVPLDLEPPPVRDVDGVVVIVGYQAHGPVVDVPTPSDTDLAVRIDHRRTCPRSLIGTAGAPAA